MKTASYGRQDGAAWDAAEDREFWLRGGVVYVGDVEVPLADESLLFHAGSEMDRSLRLSILQADCGAFAEAWQRMIHSARRTAAGYPISSLIPTAAAPRRPSKGDTQGPPSPGGQPNHAGQANQSSQPGQGGEGAAAVGPETASIIYSSVGGSMPIYAGAVYAQVVYADMLYAQVAYMQGPSPAAGGGINPPAQARTTLSITGRGEDSRRRVLAVEGIASVDLAACRSRPGLAEVRVRFAPGLPAAGLVRLIQGI